MEENFQQNYFSRTAQSIYDNGHDRIILTNWMYTLIGFMDKLKSLKFFCAKINM